MPIRFRCSRCNRLLGIARRKAGADTTCPHCRGITRVPIPLDSDDPSELSEIDELLNPVQLVLPPLTGKSQSQPTAEPVAIANPLPVFTPTFQAAPPPLPRTGVVTTKPIEDRPLFEGNLDEVLGISANESKASHSRGPKSDGKVSGTDALSLLAEEKFIVLSPQKAVAIAVIIAALMAISFAAGYLVASK